VGGAHPHPSKRERKGLLVPSRQVSVR
jgi:hypothetical protein